MYKKALILGTNATQTDFINYLKEIGWEVHACGHKKVGPGCESAHYFHLVDTIDIEAVKKLANDIDADIVYSVSSDSAIRTATNISSELGLPTLLNTEIVELFHRKDQFRKFLNEKNISTVKFLKVKNSDQAMEWDTYPCVVKPTDSQGQRGVSLVNDKKELLKEISKALDNSTSNTAIVEEYLDGVEFSSNIIIQNGKIVVNEFTDRLTFGPTYFGLPKGHAIPANSITDKQYQLAVNDISKLVSVLELTDAVLYIQMKLYKGEPRIVEVAPRLDGCHIWRLIKHHKGYDLREYILKCLIGEDIDHRESTVNDNQRSILKFHHLKTGLEFIRDNFLLNREVVFNQFRYQDHEKVVPINGKLEVVGYYIYDE